MKKQALKGFAVAVFIAVLAASSAKASSTMLRGPIPFDFTVGSATLPAGHLHRDRGHAGRASDPE